VFLQLLAEDLELFLLPLLAQDLLL
jgi:hypothetical protein